MRLTVMLPDGVEPPDAFALFPCLDITWIPTSASDFTTNLEELAESGGPSIVILTAGLLPNKPAREVWRPVLEQLEEAGTLSLAIHAPEGIALPPLLTKRRAANLARAIVQWLAPCAPPPAPPAWWTDALLSLASQSCTLTAAADGPATHREAARVIALQLRPYFEDVVIVDVPHESEVLRQVELSRITPGKRTLYIVTSNPGPTTPCPPQCSILSISDAGEVELDVPPCTATIDAQSQTLKWLANPAFATYELEQALHELFATNWHLAERLARKAGSHFRNENRVPEAIWVFELLKDQATTANLAATIQHCEDELYWLRAGGVRKQQLFEADQTRFSF